MPKKIELEMMKQPAEAVLATIDEQLDRAAESLGQTSFLSAGMQESLMAFVNVGKANIDGVRRLNQEMTSYFQADLEAGVAATKASMKAATLSDAVAIHRDRLQNGMTDGMARSSKLTELSLSMSENAFAPVQKQMGKPWAGWLRAAA